MAAGDRLAILSHNCWQFAVLSFASARAGVILVPINFMLGADEIAYILDHCQATAFVVEDALVAVADKAVGSLAQPPRIRRHIALGDGADWDDVDEWLRFDGIGRAPPRRR